MLAGEAAAAAAAAAAEDRNVGGGCIDFQANICPVLLRSSGRYAVRSPVEGRNGQTWVSSDLAALLI